MSSYDNDDDETSDGNPTKSKKSFEINNISELISYDLDEYLGGVWERENTTKKTPTPPPPTDPFPFLDTPDLNFWMESDDESVIETVMI